MSQIDQLDWPYNSEAASRLLDPDLIERQGDFFLRRALNIRRLVVFAGSGLSMAYGRVSWTELAETQITGVLAAERALSDSERGQMTPSLTSLLRRLGELSDALNDDASDVIVLSLQLAEQVWLLADESLLKELKAEFQLKLEGPLDSEEFRRKLFRHCIKAETYDERHHVKRILTDPFRSAGASDAIGIFARNYLLHQSLTRFPIREHPDFRRLFSKETVADIENRALGWANASNNYKVLFKFALDIADLLSKCCRPSGSLDPISYPGVGLALDAMRAGFRLEWNQVPDLNELSNRFKQAHRWIPPVDMLRERFVSRERDPLWTLAMNLEIKRFVTTNYDLDIERLIDDLGFRPTSYESQDHLVGDEVERIGPMGGRARDIVLGQTNATEMIDFASGESPHHVQVIHVHGRATDQEDIVVTERDYQNMYLGESSNKTVAREGMQVLFGGNPILFAGIGLSEGDLMRPLREFAMEHLRRNHSVIALAPASKNNGRRAQFVMEQYIRHGVYVLHYGFCGESNRVSWLESVFKYTRTLKEHLHAFSSIKTVEEEHQVESLPGTLIDEAAKSMLSTLSVINSDDLTSLKSFNTDRSTCDISFEIGVLLRIGSFLRSDAPDMKANLSGDGFKVVDIFFKTVLMRAVKRMEDAVRTIALSAYLRGIELHWRKWATTWSRMPRTRSDEFNFSTLEDLQISKDAVFAQAVPAGLGKTRWFRHLIDEEGSDGRARFERFLRAWLSSRSDSDTDRRRILLVAAPRGAGKGRLLGELTKHGDFLLNGKNVSPDIQLDRPERRYAAQFLINFSFSSEVASAWDALIAFLSNPLQPVAHETLAGTLARQGRIGRIGRLRLALANVKNTLGRAADALLRDVGDPHKVHPRALIVFQAFDLLFEADGYPKTAEIRAICDLLFGQIAKGAPIDLVLLLKDSRIPLYFRRMGSTALSTDRNKKCPGRTVRLITNIDELQHEAAASIVVKSDLQVDSGRSGKVVPQLLPSAHIGGKSCEVYLYFLGFEDEVNIEAISDKFNNPSWLRMLHVPLSKNRLQFRLFSKVVSDIADRFGEHERVGIGEEFALSIAGTENSQTYFALDRFFEKVLDYWSRQTTPLASDEEVLSRVVEGKRREEKERILISAYDFSLHELLLRHLAVISTPVEADVLAICPQIALRLKHLVGSAKTNAKARGLIISCALELLVSRGLVFKIYKRKVRGAERAQESASDRFQVHRTMQLHIYRKLGAQNAEPADSYSFALSLFASQARELSLLIANAYAFLHELMNELVGLPRSNNEVPSSRSSDLAVRSLKAGIGVARTLFSIGVVARFDDLGGVRVPIPPRPGYFEHHRLILRWMLLRASNIGSVSAVGTATGKSRKSHGTMQMPFYPDEMIWLFNECGVFSLAQGQMFEAIAMFDAALKGAEAIEGEANSSIRRRILLNLALCSIYRGRPNEARRQLTEIQSEESEDEAVQLIATGHLGLLDHIGGFNESAMHRLSEAIKGLIKLRRFRAVSMFLRHRGDLHRDLHDFGSAKKDLVEAIDLARLSGSQDMAWFAIVARTRLDVTEGVDLRESAKRLEDAERYADAMELPLLTSETCFVHAQMLLRQGETALAAEKVTKALRLATLHGLTLRSIAYRNLLADIHLERGWSEEAKKIRGQALQAARSAGYRLMLQRHPQGTA